MLQVCYLSIVKEQCFTGCPDVRECAYLLQHLDYADMLMIMMTKVNHLYPIAILLIYLTMGHGFSFLDCLLISKPVFRNSAKRWVFLFLNSPTDLVLSHKMDLDLLDCFREETKPLYD